MVVSLMTHEKTSKVLPRSLRRYYHIRPIDGRFFNVDFNLLKKASYILWRTNLRK